MKKITKITRKNVCFLLLFLTLSSFSQSPGEVIQNLRCSRDVVYMIHNDTMSITRYLLSNSFDVSDTNIVKNVLCSVTEIVNGEEVLVKELNIQVRNIPSSTYINTNSDYFMENNSIYFYIKLLDATESRTIRLKAYNYSNEQIQSLSQTLNF